MVITLVTTGNPVGPKVVLFTAVSVCVLLAGKSTPQYHNSV